MFLYAKLLMMRTVRTASVKGLVVFVSWLVKVSSDCSTGLYEWKPRLPLLLACPS